MAVVEPLGLEMVGAALQDEHEVALIDLLPGVDLDRTVERFSPDVCGISCSFTVDVDRSLEIAAAVKTLKPKSFVLVGGTTPHSTPPISPCPRLTPWWWVRVR